MDTVEQAEHTTVSNDMIACQAKQGACTHASFIRCRVSREHWQHMKVDDPQPCTVCSCREGKREEGGGDFISYCLPSF